MLTDPNSFPDPTFHVFVPQSGLVHAVNETFGLEDTADLPSYYQPSQRQREMASMLMRWATAEDGPLYGVELLFHGSEESDSVEGVHMIVGPETLPLLIGDDKGVESQLTDCGLQATYFEFPTA